MKGISSAFARCFSLYGKTERRGVLAIVVQERELNPFEMRLI